MAFSPCCAAIVAHPAAPGYPLSRRRPNVRIRPADAADLPAIERVVRDAYTKYIARIGKPPGPMLDDYRARVHAHEAWVLEREGVIAGVIVLLAEDDHMLLDNVAVDPEQAGTGLGRALMEFAEAEARRRGYNEIRLYTHERMTENIALYRHLGWQETGRGEQAGYSRVFFRKQVLPDTT
jgi:ribosomal protein S18 acetylase RimI-like enzyme